MLGSIYSTQQRLASHQRIEYVLSKYILFKPFVSFEDLEELDIRIGLVKKVEDIESSDKLVRLTVNIDDFIRSIIVELKKNDIIQLKPKVNRHYS